MRLNLKKTKSMMMSGSPTYVAGYSGLNLGGAKLEEVRSLRIVGVTLDSKLIFETHLHEVASKTATIVCVMRRAGELFDFPHVLNSCLNAYILSGLEYCAPE